MTDHEQLFLEAMQAFHRGYAGPPGVIYSRQVGRTAAGVRAVVDLLMARGAVVQPLPAARPENADINNEPWAAGYDRGWNACLAAARSATAPPAEQPGGEEGFGVWFAKNYPGPDTVISDPHWHAPRIFRAAIHHAQPKPEREVSDSACREADGCPTEMAVLKRFWRQHQKPEQAVGDGVAYWAATADDGEIVHSMSADDGNNGKASRQEVNDFINDSLLNDKVILHLVPLYTAPRPAVATPAEVTDETIREWCERHEIFSLGSHLTDARAAFEDAKSIASPSAGAVVPDGWQVRRDGDSIQVISPCGDMIGLLGHEFATRMFRNFCEAMLAAAPEVPRG